MYRTFDTAHAVACDVLRSFNRDRRTRVIECWPATGFSAESLWITGRLFKGRCLSRAIELL